MKLFIVICATGLTYFSVGHQGVVQHRETDQKPPALDGSYTTDPTHTSVAFEVGHLGLSKTFGMFSRHEGHIVVDSKHLAESSVEFKIDATSIDTGLDRRDVDLRSMHFFGVVNHPTISFNCHRFRRLGPKFAADGDLSMMGKSKPVTVVFELNGPIADAWGDVRIGLVADPLTIKRSDYGMMGLLTMPDGSPGVSDSVTIHLALEATKDKR